MAGPYYVYHSTANPATGAWTTNNGDSFTYAYASLKTLTDSNTLASGETVYFAADHVDPTTYIASYDIVGPTSGLPVVFISVNRTTGVREKSVTNQIDTLTSGAYELNFNGSFALYGIRGRGGNTVSVKFDCDGD